MNDTLQMPTEEPKGPIQSTRKFKQHADGIYFGLPESDYHNDPALGSSGVRDLMQSPLKYWVNSPYNPERPAAEEEDPTDKKATSATVLGSYMHDLLLEGGRKAYAIKPAGMSFATKEGKAWRDSPANEGKIIITADQAKQQRTMFNALELSGVLKWFSQGEAEVSFFWTEKGGNRCKIRLDYLKAIGAADLKTYANSMEKDTETAIAHTIAARRYSVSAFWYKHGLARMLQMIKAKGDAAVQTVHPNAPGPTDEQLDLIDGLRHHEGDFPLHFVFIETGAVPNITVREFVSHDDGELNAYWRWAKQGVDYATQQFARYMAKFGPDRIWIDEAYFKEFTDADFAAASWILAKD